MNWFVFYKISGRIDWKMIMLLRSIHRNLVIFSNVLSSYFTILFFQIYIHAYFHATNSSQLIRMLLLFWQMDWMKAFKTRMGDRVRLESFLEQDRRKIRLESVVAVIIPSIFHWKLNMPWHIELGLHARSLIVFWFGILKVKVWSHLLRIIDLQSLVEKSGYLKKAGPEGGRTKVRSFNFVITIATLHEVLILLSLTNHDSLSIFI